MGFNSGFKGLINQANSATLQPCFVTVPYLYIFCQHSGDEQAKGVPYISCRKLRWSKREAD